MNIIRYAASVEYDGYCYHGWQKQTNAVSVQQRVEEAVAVVANHPVDIICAGRTDTGVHAISQIIHFDSRSSRSNEQWKRGINSHLPSDVSVTWIQPVAGDFHARFTAQQRYYRYVIYNDSVRPSILRNHVSWIHSNLNEDLMNQAAQHLLGRHDFSSFRAVSCQSSSPVREILSISVCRKKSFIYLDISANAFLHHMVRNIAGSLIDVGSGNQTIEWFVELLQAKDRTKAGMTAPSSGLYLYAVDYPDEYELPVKPDTIRFT